MPPKPATVARVTRSSARAISGAASAPAPVVAAAAEEAPPPKKRRTTKKSAPAPVPAPALALDAKSPTRETPPPLNLADAIAHLSSVDRRFTSLFERIPCGPFVEAASTQPAAGAAAAIAAGETKDKGPQELVQRTVDPFRTLVTSIIGQQVSWMAARSITKRFVELFCGPVEEVKSRKDEGPFPTREQVAKAEVMALRGIGCSMRKAEYCEF